MFLTKVPETDTMQAEHCTGISSCCDKFHRIRISLLLKLSFQAMPNTAIQIMTLVPANYTNSIQFYVSNMFIKTFRVIAVGFSFRLHIRLQIPILLLKAAVSEAMHTERPQQS